MSLPLGKSVSPDLPPLLPTPVDVQTESLPSIDPQVTVEKDAPIASQDSELSIESDYTGEPQAVITETAPVSVDQVSVEVDITDVSPEEPSVPAEKSPAKETAQVDIKEEAKKFVETLYHLNAMTGETAAPLFENTEKIEQNPVVSTTVEPTKTWEYDAPPVVLKSPMKAPEKPLVAPVAEKSTLAHSELLTSPSQESLEAIRFTAAVHAAESPRRASIAVEVASIAEAENAVIATIETAKAHESPEKAVVPATLITPMKEPVRVPREILSQSPKVTFAATQPASNLFDRSPEKPPAEESPRPVEQSPRVKSPRSAEKPSVEGTPRSVQKSPAEKPTPSARTTDEEPTKPDLLARKTRGREVFLRPDDAAVFQLIKQRKMELKKNSPSPRKRNSLASPSPRKSSSDVGSTPSKQGPSPKKARTEAKKTKPVAKRKADTVPKATKKPKVTPKTPAVPKAKPAKKPVQQPAKKPAKKAVRTTPSAAPRKARGKK